MVFRYLFCLAASLLSLAASAQTQAPAFPGAEGHARYITGGRGGKVIHVTNLNDSGTGSLRAALGTSGARTIVFDVSGYIDLKSDLVVSKGDVTIAGQTAPAPGVTLRYYTFQIKANNIIVRFLRFRRSQLKDINDGADAAWGRNCTNVIFDHCSFSWSIDELASFYDNCNFTLQWCMLGEGLREPGHSKGAHSYGGIWGGKGASFHHNMIVHVDNRAPRFNGARYAWSGYDKNKYSSTVEAEIVDFRNCVMYNWGTGNGCYGGPGGGNINIVNNYYKAGPGTSATTRVTQVSVGSSSNSGSDAPELYGYASRYFINGNYVTAAGSSAAGYDWKGVKVDGGLATINGETYIPDASHKFGSKVTYVKNSGGVDCVSLKMTSPTESGEVTTHTAQVAFEKVLANAGASLFRDDVDARYAEEARTGTTTLQGTDCAKGLINLVQLEKPAGNADAYFPALESNTRDAKFDSDKDGMPDAWESMNGLNPNNAADATTKTLDSKGFYTNLEVYINSIVEDIVLNGNAGATTSVSEYFPVCNTFNPNHVQCAIADPEAVSFLYYTMEGKAIPEPVFGQNIRVTIFSDGSRRSDVVLKK